MLLPYMKVLLTSDVLKAGTAGASRSIREIQETHLNKQRIRPFDIRRRAWRRRWRCHWRWRQHAQGPQVAASDQRQWPECALKFQASNYDGPKRDSPDLEHQRQPKPLCLEWHHLQQPHGPSNRTESYRYCPLKFEASRKPPVTQRIGYEENKVIFLRETLRNNEW